MRLRWRRILRTEPSIWELQIGVRKLIAWQKAHQLVLGIYRLASDSPSHELFGLTSQLRRPVVSVPANIVEGYTRSHTGESRQSLNVAKGSLAEVEYYLELSRDLGYLDSTKYDELATKLSETAGIIDGLFKAISGRGDTSADSIPAACYY